eukprot:jgi/Bigna1/68288/fgenesh1_pg.5_\
MSAALPLALIAITTPLSFAVHVSVLSGHDSSAWSRESACRSSDNLELIKCNLKVYTQAASVASSDAKADILLLPEGYGLAGMPSWSTYYEPLISSIGFNPCLSPNVTAPQQTALSCAARENQIAIATNIFVQFANKSRRITEIVFDSKGRAVSIYHKHHLFPSEMLFFKSGPFAPSTFSLLGRRWGVAICYEGVYPTITGDYSQFDSLIDQGATTLLWSVGGVPSIARLTGGHLAKKFNVSMLVSTLGSSEVFMRNGTSSFQEITIDGLQEIGYQGNASVRHLELA